MQKKILAACLVLTVAALADGFQSTAQWVKYTSVEGRYSILLPQEPKLSTQEGTASTGEKLMNYGAQSSDSDGLYGVNYFDGLPGMTFSLDKARDGMVSAVKGTLLNEDTISLGGYPGRELKITAKNGELEILISARIYSVGGRSYVLQHAFLKASDSPIMVEKTTKFFDSFKVTESK